LVVTYNQYEITKRFIEVYLKYFRYANNLHLLLLDNNSSDDTWTKIKSEYKDIEIRKLRENYGCVTGRNIGIVELIKEGCEYIYHSDNDIIIEDAMFFEKLLRFHAHNPSYDGSCPVVRYYATRKIQTAGSRIYGFNIIRNITRIDENNRINILPGCAQFIKSISYIKYGLYDNDLSPLSIEDREWGIRATKLGAKLAYNKNVEVLHDHKNIEDIPNIRISYAIIGNMVFLKNHFTLFNVLMEIKSFIYYSKKTGLLFALRCYGKGMLKKINKNNYLYESFKKIDDNNPDYFIAS
jgi:GT2 family glycosyltransferase